MCVLYIEVRGLPCEATSLHLYVALGDEWFK